MPLHLTADLLLGLPLVDHLQSTLLPIREELPDLVNIPDLAFKVVHADSFQLGSTAQIKAPPEKQYFTRFVFKRQDEM